MRTHLSLLSCSFAKGQEDAFMFKLLQPREAGAALKNAKRASLEIALWGLETAFSELFLKVS